MKVLTLYNAKGGVGKTASAMAIAASLAKDHGFSVCCIDLDLTQCSLSGFLLPDYKSRPSIVDAMLERASFEEVTAVSEKFRAKVRQKCPDLYICPCSASVREHEMSVSSFPNRENALREVLADPAAQQFDFVIIDCPPSMNALTRNAIVASDGVLVPYKNDKSAFNGISIMLAESAEIKERYNAKLEFLGVFFTMDKNLRVNNQVKALLREDLGDRFMNTTIREAAAVIESSFAGLPVNLYSEWSAPAFDYKRLTGEILQKLDHTTTA